MWRKKEEGYSVEVKRMDQFVVEKGYIEIEEDDGRSLICLPRFEMGSADLPSLM